MVVNVVCDVVNFFIVALDVDSILFVIVSFHLTWGHGNVLFVLVSVLVVVAAFVEIVTVVLVVV